MGDSAHTTTARAALVTGLVAVLFTGVMCLLLWVTHIQLRRIDPLNGAMLVELRDRYADGERGEQIRQDIRQLDLLARKAFFVSRRQIRTGGIAAAIGGTIALLALGLHHSETRRVTVPAAENPDGEIWAALARSRAWVAGGAVILTAVSLVMALSARTGLENGGERDRGEGEREGISTSNIQRPTPNARGGDAEVPVLPQGFSDNSPVFRGPNGSGYTSFANVPTAWDEAGNSNLLWKTDLELWSWASPVVWGDRVIALGADADRRVVYCLDAGTGEAAWTTEIPSHDKATLYTPDTTDERWDRLVYAGATPAVNGKQVFVLFSNGQLAALDLRAGRVDWHIVPGATAENEYGVENSLLVYRDSVIVVFQGNETFIARYDAATGKEIWKTARESPSWSSPILAKREDGAYLVVLAADPDISAWDPETGELAWSTNVLTGGPEFVVGPSPVQVGNRLFVNCQNCGMYGLNVSDGALRWSLEELPDGSGFSDGASMTTDGRYLYQFFGLVLTCVDPEDGTVVGQKDMDLFGNYASASLNGGRLYLFGSGEAMVVDADPETDFAAIGRGSIEDACDTTVVIVEGRVYMRSDTALYCFGEKGSLDGDGRRD